MTPETFIDKWKASTLTERAAAQSHFNDLCALLGEMNPTDADPTGEEYAFERGANKTSGGRGWADVWKRGCFAWEYKGKRKDLKAAYAQLQQYAVALENPPLLVVCDMNTIEVHTNWTNTVREVHRFGIDDLRDAGCRAKLKAAFSDPERLKPGQTRQALTESAAEEFAGLAQRLRARGFDPQRVAHFVNRLVFCMFAEDVGLLPREMFKRALDEAMLDPAEWQTLSGTLFGIMKRGGRFGLERVAWFNGGLFDDDDTLALEKDDIAQALKAARLNWADIDPSIFGTLFERGLDPDKRSQLGAHYTDRDKIMMIVEPVILRPLTAEWAAERDRIAERLQMAQDNLRQALSHAVSFPELEDEVREVRAYLGSRAQLELFEGLDRRRLVRGLDAVRSELRAAARALAEARQQGESELRTFLQRLRGVRVLDPACGSGNFLYLALLALKDLEHRVNLDAEALGFQRAFPAIGPESVLGIEVNGYAAELARVSVWIGEIQWMRRNGFAVPANPILKPLHNIERRDALLTPEGEETEWPEADFIVGNPPFLGADRFLRKLGREETDRLRRRYADRLPGMANLVTYWFERARRHIEEGKCRAAGLVATRTIRQQANRFVLERLTGKTRIFEARNDEPWINEGAAVRVCIVCFGDRDGTLLNGQPVAEIFPDLTGVSASEMAGPGAKRDDFTRIHPLAENLNRAFPGSKKHGSFDIPGDLARQWLHLPNPHGRPNSDVLKPLWNGYDVTRRPRDMWVIDFGTTMPEREAALYEKPFEHVLVHVKPERETNGREAYRRYWWRHGEPRVALRAALSRLERYMAISEKSKHFYFAWVPVSVLPDNRLIVVAHAEDSVFGLLSSRLHRLWALRVGGTLEDRPCYTPTTCFQTFPFPESMANGGAAKAEATDRQVRTVAEAARRLTELRENWVNPPSLVRRLPETADGYPDRILPIDAKAAAFLKKRTLTNLYNERPSWLASAHRELDGAVAAAYGWPADLSDEEALSRLLDLNLERAAAASTVTAGAA